ncbi:MAG: sugar transferase [Candidatus Absconditabacterales bacterium]|nr:sugar transferase [Candidatus Absconditabacterales bacterium]
MPNEPNTPPITILQQIFPPSTHPFLQELSKDVQQKLVEIFSSTPQPDYTESHPDSIQSSIQCSRDEAKTMICKYITQMNNSHTGHKKSDSTNQPTQAEDLTTNKTSSDIHLQTLHLINQLITDIETDLCIRDGQAQETYSKHHIMQTIKRHVAIFMQYLINNNLIHLPTKGRCGTILIPFIAQIENGQDKINHTIKFQSMIDHADIVLALLKYLNTFCIKESSKQNQMRNPLCHEPLLQRNTYYGKYDPDPRITRLGKRIRKMNIDELLQILLIRNDHLSIRGRLWKYLGRHIFLTKEAWNKIQHTTNIDLAGIRPCVPHYATTLATLYAATQDNTIKTVIDAIKLGGYTGFIPLTYAIQGNYSIHQTNAALITLKDSLHEEQRKQLCIILFNEGMKKKFGRFRGIQLAWLIR